MRPGLASLLVHSSFPYVCDCRLSVSNLFSSLFTLCLRKVYNIKKYPAVMCHCQGRTGYTFSSSTYACPRCHVTRSSWVVQLGHSTYMHALCTLRESCHTCSICGLFLGVAQSVGIVLDRTHVFGEDMMMETKA
ncbi:hypothetical protein M404DRAFT_488030 [Pisolithus tinctorius Marx 270]|uniref:Uncharacterized protein n=1 Tax=Pisolithus tinctorius Marx 270 TaxID=870435 RepID=A0A0C3K8Q0_PISTI|nr:hypothetical protein M404DRAFT_488030 [Pisolithus tinctorius Marx 270]